jgi:hypothetical protein
MKTKSISAGLRVLTLAATLLLPTGAVAISFTWDLVEEYSGAQAPENSYSVTIADAGLDTVTIAMSVSGTSSTEFVGEWYFNYTGDASLLTITAGASNPVGTVVVSHGLDCCSAAGNALFDIRFDFPPPPGGLANKFVVGETVVYTITGVSGLDASDFFTPSTPSDEHGELYVAAQVRGVGALDGSGWVTTPEPGAVGVFSLGLLVAGGLIHRLRRRDD